MKLIRDWRKSWKWFSVQALALQGAASAAWLAVPDDMRASVSADTLATVALVLAALGVIGRLVHQGGDDA